MSAEWLDRAKDQLETHATTLHAIEAIGKLIKKALVDPGTDTYAVIQVIEKITDALIDSFTHGAKLYKADVEKQILAVFKSEETVNEAADRKLAEKFGKP
jgi:hypothetical protein